MTYSVLTTIFLSLLLAGCAELKEYNPVKEASKGQYLINQESLKKLEVGMTMDKVHEIMGQELVIGYSLDNTQHYRPRVIANPIKTETLKTLSGDYFVEYYVSSTISADQTITNDKLSPVYFKDGKLVIKPRD